MAWQTIPLTLTGTTFDGTLIRGQDSVFLLGGIDIECLCDFDCDADVDGTDALAFKRNFGRGTLRNPCTEEDPCDGDLNSDADVDGNDAFTFKGSYGTVLYRPQ